MVLGRGYCEAVEQKMESLSLHTERAPFSVCDVMRGEGLAPPKLDTHLTQVKIAATVNNPEPPIIIIRHYPDCISRRGTRRRLSKLLIHVV
jgi:hypothetical protein